MPASLTLPIEVLERGFSLTSRVVSLTVGEKGKIKHLQHFQPNVEDVSFKACVSRKHKMPMLVFTSKFLAKSADFAISDGKCCNAQTLCFISL